MEKSDQAGGKIVAEIGAEKITEADLDALIENMIANQLIPMQGFMTAQQLNEQKKQILLQYKTPQAKQQFLQVWLAQEILYRQALEEKLTDQADVKKMLDDSARAALSQHLMTARLADKINITDNDLKTFYQANKDKYIEPADEEDGTAERQKSFDEVRQQVAMELFSEKRQEIQAEFIKQMMDKFNVIIHTSAFASKDPNEK